MTEKSFILAEINITSLKYFTKGTFFKNEL